MEASLRCGLALLAAVVAGGSAGTARAHGPPPLALSVLAWEGGQPQLVRLNVGLARRLADGRFRFVCPAAWEDERGAPAVGLSGGGAVIAGTAGLFVLDGDGRVRRHPDPNARGTSLDLVRSAEQVFALRVGSTGSEVLAVDAERVSGIWSAADGFLSVAADERGLLLLRADDVTLTWQWLDSDGSELEAGEVVAPSLVDYAFARAQRGRAYALLLEQGRPTLGELSAPGFVPLASAASSIAGPLAVGDVDLLATDGQLSQLVDGQLEALAAHDAYVSCLEQTDGLPYVCTRAGLSQVSEQGVGEGIFALSKLAPPDLTEFVDAEQQGKCEIQWQDLRFDLLALGVEVEPEPDSVADASVMDPAEPEAGVVVADAGDDVADARGQRRGDGGCSALSVSQRAGWAWLSFVLGLFPVVTRLRRRGWGTAVGR